VRPALKEAVEDLHPSLRQMAEYSFGWLPGGKGYGGGKGIRPALALLSAEMMGAPAVAAVPGAAAVELVHAFSLIHDDIMDHDELRRHRPTAWRVYGIEGALLGGDGLLAVAIRCLVHAPSRAVRLLADCLVELVNGQAADMAFEARPWTGPDAVTVDEHTKMVAGKSGALLGCAAGLGTLLGGGTADAVSAMSRTGRDLGIAFQATDDMLGIWGDPAVTGKPVLSDLRRRKKTLPVVAALTGQGAARHALAEMLDAHPDGDDLPRVAALISDAEGRTAAARQADTHLNRALDTIRGVAVNQAAADELTDLSRYIINRLS
jgi:geranylgeranyl diphosphate synthase type I